MSARTVFELSEERVKLYSKNDRTEKHGEEEVLACDLDFHWETSNGCLAMFAPDLRSGLYKASDGAQLELAPDPEHLVSLRFPQLGVLKWAGGELVGGELVFHYGTTAKSNIKVDCTKIHKYRLEPKEGGTVVVSFQVQCRPSEQQAGKFSKFLTDPECVVSVIPPAPPADAGQGEL